MGETETISLAIVIPAHNAEHTVERAIASTRELRRLGAEVVVVDDGSTDATREVILAIASREPGVVVVSQANEGPFFARYTGVKRSTAPWITFLDADDVLVCEGILEALEAATQTGRPIAKARIATTDDVILGEPMPRPARGCSVEVRNMPRWLLRGWGGHTGAIYARPLLELGGDGLFTARLPFGEDLVFSFWLCTQEHEYAEVDAVAYVYQIGQAIQSTAAESERRLEIGTAFATCELLAQSASVEIQALLWMLIMRYRLSRARHVSPRLRGTYRRTIALQAKGLRRRLRLSRSRLALGIVINLVSLRRRPFRTRPVHPPRSDAS